MNSSQCPECGSVVNQTMTACATCGHPIMQLPPSCSERWPLFQYGLIAFAIPVSLSGVAMALRMQGIEISNDIMGLGIVLGALIAVCLFAAAFVDRTYFNRGKPAGSIRVVSWFTIIVFLLAIIWLLLANVAEQAGFKLEGTCSLPKKAIRRRMSELTSSATTTYTVIGFGWIEQCRC